MTIVAGAASFLDIGTIQGEYDRAPGLKKPWGGRGTHTSPTHSCP